MKSRLIVDRILQPEHFLRASSQEGPYPAQAVPNVNNDGFLRLISKGNSSNSLADFEYNGTATAVGGTVTLQDSILSLFGDDFFIGATITFTAGANSSGSTKITDFHGATGCLVWNSSVTQTASGDSYTLTLDFTNRQFDVVLISSGDPGNATFKWSHDAGEHYLGRDNPFKANWLGQARHLWTIGQLRNNSICEAANGDLIIACIESTFGGDDAVCYISSDDGLTWSDEIVIYDLSPNALSSISLISLRSGRLLCAMADAGSDGRLCYSDDYGRTWSVLTTESTIATYAEHLDLVELNNENLVMSYYTADAALCMVSTDSGRTWSSGVTISTNSNYAQYYPMLVEAANGDLVCVYNPSRTGVAPEPAYVHNIDCRISDDGGSSWGATKSVIAMNCATRTEIGVCKDCNGDLFVAGVEYFATTSRIMFNRSTDNGQSWGTSTVLYAHTSGTTPYAPSLALYGGHLLLCAFSDQNEIGAPTTMQLLCRGAWSNYSAVSAVPCAIEAKEQKLICGAGVKWYGGEGIANDKWTFSPAYWYSMKNTIADSPNKVWRSTTDDVTCELIIDMGTTRAFFANAIALFNCNISSCSIELNTSDDWSLPGVSQNVSFVLGSGTIDEKIGNYIKDESFLNDYKQHELGDGNFRLAFTSGTSYSYLIEDNTEDYFVIDATTSEVTAADTFNVYQNSISHFFPGGAYRYMRIYIPAHKTPEGYYQIGSMLVGSGVTLNNTWADNGYSIDHDYNIEILRSLSGSMTANRKGSKRRTFNVNFDRSENSRREVEAIVNFSRGKNIALIPDSNSATAVYLVKAVGNVKEDFRYGNRWDLSLQFEENS